MRANIAYLPALAALAHASPVANMASRQELAPRQELDIALLNSAPDPTPVVIPIGGGSEVVTYDMAAATAEATATPLPIVDKMAKRSACDPQPSGYGPVISPDTPDQFLIDSSLDTSGAVTPAGYVQKFVNKQASSSAYGYTGYKTLKTYDVASCAAGCTKNSKCLGFNIFYERDPTLEPATACPDPASTTNIKCVYYGGYVEEAGLLNKGQTRNQFKVVIAGSNGYMKDATQALPITVPSYNGTFLGDYSLNAPSDCNGADTFMGSKVFTTSTYDPNLCKAACESQNDYNTAHPDSSGYAKICKFFVTYMAAKDGLPQGQYCSLYNETWPATYAVNDGQTRDGHKYTNGYGFSYSLTGDIGVCTPKTTQVIPDRF